MALDLSPLLAVTPEAQVTEISGKSAYRMEKVFTDYVSDEGPHTERKNILGSSFWGAGG